MKPMSRKRKTTTIDMDKIAKQYGLANGFYGQLGGWIYKDGDKRMRTSGRWKGKVQKPICQGWGQLWHSGYATAIRNWMRKKELDA